MPECRNILMNKKAKKLKENDGTKNPSSFFKIFYCEATEEIVAVTLDQNLLFYKLKSLKLSKQVCFEKKFVFVLFFKNDKEAHSLNFLFFLTKFIGHYDDLLDVQYFGSNEEYITVATNSEQIKVIHTETGSSQVLFGHTGI